MRIASFVIFGLIFGSLSLIAERARLGPDLKIPHPHKTSLQSKAPNRFKASVTSNNVDRDLELLPERQSLPDVPGLRFASTIDYAGLETGDVGSGWGGFIFGPGDSAMVWYRPDTDCTLEQISFRVHSESDLAGNTVEVLVYSVKADWWQGMGNGTYDFSLLDAVFEDNGPHDELLLSATVDIGTEVGPNVSHVVDILQWTDNGLPLDLGSNDFIVVIGLPMDGDQDLADFYYGNLYSDIGQYHGFKYYQNGIGWKSRLNFAITATVDYYGDPPPFIEGLTDLSDVYYSDNPGPYSVSAKVYDRGIDDFEGGLTAVELRYQVNEGVEQVVVLNDQIPSADSVYTGMISGVSIGDQVNYHFYAADNGAENSTDSVMHESNSRINSFSIREASQFTNLLLINDNNLEIAATHWAPLLDYYGFLYDYWDTAVSGFPTRGVLDNYQTLFWAQANQGAGILADSSMESSVRGFMDAGGNLFLSSSDYIGEMLPNDPWDPVWQETTQGFLRDYLHVSLFVSDANVGGPDAVSQDVLYIGVEGSPISGEWSDEPFSVDPARIGLNNWADEVFPADYAEVAFRVWSISDDTWVEAGILYDGDYKMVFLPWQFEAIVDEDIRLELLSNIASFMYESIHIRPTYEGGSRYAQAADAGDIVVYGSLAGGGETFSMGVDYTQDGGDTWLSVPMVEGDATIPALAVGDTCTFMVTATDTEGGTGYGDLYNVWKIDFTPAADILYVGDEAYTWYYGAKYDSVNYARTLESTEACGLTMDYYDLDELYLMDTYSILNRYNAVIWNAYGDWNPTYMPLNTFDNPLSEYVLNGGKLLYSSEEIIGTWFDWPQYQDFYQGQFMYDILEVNWAANDFGIDSIAPDPNGDYTGGMSNFNLESSDFFWGNQSDLCDPIGFWTGTAHYDPPFQSIIDEGGGGRSPNSARTRNTTFLAFSMMMMPDSIYATFIEHWLATVAIDESISSIPTAFTLGDNYPNPFNPSTCIDFELPASSEVKISIYNVLGQKIIDLVNNDYTAGEYSIAWNGLNAAGIPVSSGIYLCKMTAGSFTASNKMLFLK